MLSKTDYKNVMYGINLSVVTKILVLYFHMVQLPNEMFLMANLYCGTASTEIWWNSSYIALLNPAFWMNPKLTDKRLQMRLICYVQSTTVPYVHRCVREVSASAYGRMNQYRALNFKELYELCTDCVNAPAATGQRARSHVRLTATWLHILSPLHHRSNKPNRWTTQWFSSSGSISLDA